MNSAKQKRKKPKQKKQQDIQLFVNLLLRKMEKFYLVGITGRTSFILQNLRGIKFKVTIGNEIKCSCSPEIVTHCVHSLYVLTQIFYIQTDNPLLFQSQYSDKDLRYFIANRRIHSNRISDFLRCIKKKVGNKQNVIIEQEDQDDMENLCAICHMQIVKSDAITSCTNVCRNTFHLDCFSQWMKYELKNNGVVKCPLCRDVKGQEDLRIIKVKQYELKQSINSKKVGVCYNYYCDGCQLKQIQEKSAVYKCVTCEDVTLCQGCFNSGKHIKHSFICKPANQKKWKQCEDRKGKKKLDADQGFIRMKMPGYKRLYNFLASCYPSYFSKNNRWNVVECKKLDIKIQELECMMCKDPQKSFLRKLPCGHFIHHKCLRKRIQKGKLYCKHEGQKFLAGYESLLKQEELNKKVEFQINAQLQKQQQQELQKSIKQQNGEKQLSNCKTLKSLNNSHSTSCDSRRKKHRDKSKQLRNKSLLNKFNSSLRIA